MDDTIKVKDAGKKMIYVKKHNTEYGIVLAMCDEELLGKVYQEGKQELDLKTYANFYKGDCISESEAEKLAESETIYSANIVGKRSVKLFIDKEIISEESVRYIEGIPYVQIFKIEE